MSHVLLLSFLTITSTRLSRCSLLIVCFCAVHICMYDRLSSYGCILYVGLRTLDFLRHSVHRVIKLGRGLCSCLIVYTILCLCVLIKYLCLSHILAEQAERKISEGIEGGGPFLLLYPLAAYQGASCQNVAGVDRSSD